jgi:hypothetical protein
LVELLGRDFFSTDKFDTFPNYDPPPDKSLSLAHGTFPAAFVRSGRHGPDNGTVSFKVARKIKCLCGIAGGRVTPASPCRATKNRYQHNREGLRYPNDLTG